MAMVVCLKVTASSGRRSHVLHVSANLAFQSSSCSNTVSVQERGGAVCWGCTCASPSPPHSPPGQLAAARFSDGLLGARGIIYVRDVRDREPLRVASGSAHDDSWLRLRAGARLAYDLMRKV